MNEAHLRDAESVNLVIPSCLHSVFLPTVDSRVSTELRSGLLTRVVSEQMEGNRSTVPRSAGADLMLGIVELTLNFEASTHSSQTEPISSNIPGLFPCS
jgi:hypothetical protein